MGPFPETIPALLERSRTELLFESDRWSPAEVLAAARAAALGQAERGVGRGDRVALLLGNRPDGARLLIGLPLFHINAQAYSTMGALGGGASLALLPRFSASRFWEETRRLGATQFNAVGALIHILLKGEPRPDDRENPIRLC